MAANCQQRVTSPTQGQILPVLLMAQREAVESLPAHFLLRMTSQGVKSPVVSFLVPSFPGTSSRDSQRVHRPSCSSEAASSCLSLLSPEKQHWRDWVYSMQQ